MPHSGPLASIHTRPQWTAFCELMYNPVFASACQRWPFRPVYFALLFIPLSFLTESSLAMLTFQFTTSVLPLAMMKKQHSAVNRCMCVAAFVFCLTRHFPFHFCFA